MFALCNSFVQTDGIRILPQGKYLCADCTEDNREETLRLLTTKAKDEYGASPPLFGTNNRTFGNFAMELSGAGACRKNLKPLAVLNYCDKKAIFRINGFFLPKEKSGQATRRRPECRFAAKKDCIYSGTPKKF